MRDRRRTGEWRCLVVLLAWHALATPAAAQRTTASVEGVVRDRAGAGLEGATITATDRAIGVERTVTSTADGHFLLAALPVEGTYDVRAERVGFTTVTRQRVAVAPGQTLAIDFVLDLTSDVVITVAGTSGPLLDRQHSTLMQVVPDTLLRALPVFGNNVFRLASLAPGFTGNPDFPNPLGQSYSANNVLVDTASHFSKWRSTARGFHFGYGLESIQQVQVRTSLFSAEFGDALASVMSVTTKAGTNAWHGSALLFVRDSALDAPPPFSTRTPAGGGQQFGFSIGGPVATTATHLFASYEGHRTRNNNVVISPAARDATVPDNQDEHLAFVRLDQQMGSGQQLAVRYNGQRFRWHYEPGGLTLPGSGTGYRNDAQTVLATHALQLSPAVTSEWRVQFAQYVDIRRDLQSTTYVSRAGYSIEGGRIGPVGFGASPEHTWEAANTWAYATTRHSLRAGAGLNYVRAHNMALTYGHGAYFFAGSPSDYPQPFLFVQGIAPSSEAPYADPRSLSTFFFVQDDLKVRSALTLNLGLRYDVERVFAVSGYQPRVDVNNVQPRLGVAWDVGGRGRTVWRGGIGVFTQQLLLFPINRVEMEGPDGVRTITVAPDSPLMPSYPARFTSIQPGAFVPPRDLALVDASFRSPYSVQSAIGVQRVLFGNVLSVDVVRLDGRDLVSLVDVNAPASIHKPALRTVEQADATRPLVPTPGSYRKLLTLGNQGRSWYRALQVTLARRAAPVHVLASYTLSRADDMASSELPEDSRNLLAEKARSSADVRHNVTAGLTWELPGVGPLTRGWSLAGVVMLRSNRPYTITWGDDRNGTTQGDARPDGRNTGMTGPYRTVDLSLSRRFGRGPRTIDARVDAFNVFNTINYDQYVGELLSPSYGRPVSAFPQRRLQVAVVTRF